jgi:hypothetical protein
MTNLSLREKILEYIVKIQNKETKENVPIIMKKLLHETGSGIYHLEINNIKLRKSSEFLITYICSICEVETSVGTTQMLRKIRNGVLPKCLSCCSSSLTIPQKKEKVEIHQQSIQEFDKNYNSYLKNAYFLSHLTEDDFERIRKNIISFGNGKYTDLNNYEFWSIYKVNNNQLCFSSVIYDKITKNIFKSDQSIIKCDNCLKPWRCKSLEKFKNDYKLLCPECKLCNRTIKIHSIQNINNEIIIYQTKLELKFIHWCNNNNFVVRNGENYNFKINDYFIEISKKQRHIEDIEKHFFITPQNWNQQIFLLQKNLDKI